MKTFVLDAARPTVPGIEYAGEKLMLSALPVGLRARIVSIDGSSVVARRLIEMGVVPGVRVEVIGTAPLGDPLKIFVRGYYLALRRAEAQTITVRVEAEDMPEN